MKLEKHIWLMQTICLQLFFFLDFQLFLDLECGMKRYIIMRRFKERLSFNKTALRGSKSFLIVNNYYVFCIKVII